MIFIVSNSLYLFGTTPFQVVKYELLQCSYLAVIVFVCNGCRLLSRCADGASDPDAEPDERETDGHADRLVQGVPQVLWILLHGDICRTRCRVSFVRWHQITD